VGRLNLTLPFATSTLVPGTGGQHGKVGRSSTGCDWLPEEDLGQVQDATITLKNGRTARVTMHLIEGSKEEIESTFHQSIEAFFDMYPEIEPVSGAAVRACFSDSRNFPGSTLGSPNASLISTVDCPVSSNRFPPFVASH